MPKDITGVKSFLGAAGHYRRFIRSFASIAAPLNFLTRKNVPFSWFTEQQTAFRSLKHSLTSAPVLTHYDQKAELVLETDASKRGLAAVLNQRDKNNQLQVLAYASRRLTQAEANYSTSEQELLAVVWSVLHFHHYLGGSKEFQIVTDHNALVGLLKNYNHSGRLAR